ncbi:hypothetical protein BXO88_13055 [Oribacterium sp. C9]|uniref:hypothetical protein n=1 Tax=Oribacterium sp. C9 TaxID=1943579 RepID=UPI00098FACC3|nr:hypothetical protein [Oribacterium sp. C9]OON85306.1 hypothetical protein BXO88_13055 [Oribacterium sp. C9]
MKKNKIFMTTIGIIITLTVTSFAGSWGKGSEGWYYLNDDGSYVKSGWEWIDGDADGIAECYYFDENGWLLEDTTTPDGHTVDKRGAWIKDGVVQQKNSMNQLSNARVWTDGIYTLADATNGDYTSRVTITIQGDKLMVSEDDSWSGTTNSESYTYYGMSSLDNDSADSFISDVPDDSGDRFLLFAASDGRIYGMRENSEYGAICWYESIEEHEAFIQNFWK